MVPSPPPPAKTERKPRLLSLTGTPTLLPEWCQRRKVESQDSHPHKTTGGPPPQWCPLRLCEEPGLTLHSEVIKCSFLLHWSVVRDGLLEGQDFHHHSAVTRSPQVHNVSGSHVGNSNEALMPSRGLVGSQNSQWKAHSFQGSTQGWISTPTRQQQGSTFLPLPPPYFLCQISVGEFLTQKLSKIQSLT